jgi:hypothetical protein
MSLADRCDEMILIDDVLGHVLADDVDGGGDKASATTHTADGRWHQATSLCDVAEPETSDVAA